MVEDDADSFEPEPAGPSSPLGRRIDVAPALRGLGAERLELELGRMRLVREAQDAMACATLRIEDALADSPVDEWLDAAVVCRGLARLPVDAAVARLQASRRVEVDRGRVRRGPGYDQ